VVRDKSPRQLGQADDVETERVGKSEGLLHAACDGLRGGRWHRTDRMTRGSAAALALGRCVGTYARRNQRDECRCEIDGAGCVSCV
jgi:hypothetical protein